MRSVDGSSTETSKGQKTDTSKAPKVLKRISKLQNLIKSKQPSFHMQYNLINILYSYVYICRFYNGCHCDFLQEAVLGLWKLSAVLCHNVNFDSINSALQSSVESSQRYKEFFNSEEFSISIIDDVLLLLKGCENELESHFVEIALSEIYRLLDKGVNIYQSDKDNPMILMDKNAKNIAKLLWLAKKKVYFMLSWFCENQDECLSLEPILPVVKEAIKLELKQLQDDKTMMEKSRLHGSFRNKKLIEEIN